MKLWLQALSPHDLVKEILIERFPFVIGRQSESDCPLPLAFISRRQCEFTRVDKQIYVQDLESYNGTFVNGKRATTPLPLHNGDELHLGPTPFRVVVQPGPETAELFLGSTRDEAPSDEV